MTRQPCSATRLGSMNNATTHSAAISDITANAHAARTIAPIVEVTARTRICMNMAHRSETNVAAISDSRQIISSCDEAENWPAIKSKTREAA